MLNPGDKAPEFALANDEGEDTSLADLLLDGPLILYFYPADFTPGCTKEACSIRDIQSEMEALGAVVLGVSPDTVESHVKFRDKYELPFTLLSDPNKDVVRMYDVDGMFGVGVQRATFLISQDRVIQDAVIANVRISRHAEFIERAVALRETADERG